MLLIYYRDAAGKICDYMRPPAGWTLGQIKQEIESFNSLHGGGFRAHLRSEEHTSELQSLYS